MKFKNKKVDKSQFTVTNPCHNTLLHLRKQKIFMQNQKIESFQIIGISARTSNLNGQAAKDIGALWEKFIRQNLIEKIPNKISQEIYCIYTNYQGDHTKPYDTILGCKVESIAEIPEGFVTQSFDSGIYQKFICKGDLTKGAVANTWNEIWNSNIDRAYSADFEIYGSKAMNPQDAEVDIFISIN